MKKKIIIISAVTIIVILGIVLTIVNSKNDGMENTREVKISYKTYTNNGWSKWSKNGITSGNKKDAIKNIKIKVKSKVKGETTYQIYTDNDWKTGENNKKNITGLKLSMYDTMYKKYDICYRTYNNKNKWLAWTCNGYVSGNKDENITALEIKIIPKDVVKYDWLKGYNSSSIQASINFDE